MHTRSGNEARGYALPTRAPASGNAVYVTSTFPTAPPTASYSSREPMLTDLTPSAQAFSTTSVAGFPDAEAEPPQRKSTDVHWLLAFAGLACVTFFFLLLAFAEGSPSRLTRGLNYQGKTCGVDGSVRDLPFLYVPLDPRERYASLMVDDARCVSQCPSEQDVEAGKTIPVPVRETDTDPNRSSSITVQFALQSPAYAATLMAGAYCVPLDTSLRQQMGAVLNSHFRQIQVALGSFRAAWGCVFGYTILAAFFAAALAFLLRLSPGVVLGATAVWTICLAVVAGASLVSTGLSGVLDPDKGNFYALDYSWALLVGILLVAAGGLLGLLLFVARRAVGNAVRLLECAGEAVFDMLQIFLAPVIFGAIASLWTSFWIEGYLYIVSAGTVDKTQVTSGIDPNGDVDVLPLHRSLVWDARFILFGLGWWVALFWVVEILSAFCQFVIAYSATVWYFSPPEGAEERDVGWYPPLVALGLGAKHHLGSFVVGGLVLGITRPLRLFFAWASSKSLALHRHSPVVQSLTDCFRSVMQPITFVVDRFTSSGFIEMSISSRAFFPAMDKSCSRILNSRSPASYFHGLASICSLIGTSAVSLTVSFMCYQTLTGTEKFASLTSPNFVAAPLGVSLFVAFISAVIASQYMAIWDTVADTFMYCFLVESVQPPVVDENPITKVHAPACLRELLLDAQQEMM
ncbi:plasma-membrane choline transporter [Toxoplasma gondii RUB]|uniref:Choline transporter-like protein n=3 Tax=Toxoplasma gondii TaxID=5811 RepID=A0A086LJ88_TOXGO|nr:plasma-membrane choline transporter [Toxoplasma gondii RUB]PUA87631.1 plasma-membrane choline transporter [Toxoplasma gondii TgCATBr9]RQX75021.1 plasma-membrane choline transporter [Toxoplasma gondii CAST]